MSTSNLKISIAALSLCVSAVAIYIHLPYVIAAVSGSGEIEAVPLAIFAVSAIVALVSVIYLIRLAVSRAGDKKKIDLSGEESAILHLKYRKKSLLSKIVDHRRTLLEQSLKIIMHLRLHQALDHLLLQVQMELLCQKKLIVIVMLCLIKLDKEKSSGV